MKNLLKIINDVFFVSKLTKINNKKKLIIVSVLLSQIAVIADVLIIIIFSSLIVNQTSEITLLQNILTIIFKNKILIFVIVLIRYISQYYQNLILKKLEQNVWKNLRTYFLSEMLSRRSYSTGDAYFYINSLSMHVSYFYSNFANFVNSILQIAAYLTYLLIVDTQTVGVFSIGVLIIILPVKYILKKAKYALDQVFNKDLASNKELERIVDNFLLIKILKKEKIEIENYTKILENAVKHAIDNHKYGIINSFLPTMFIFVVLTFLIVFTKLLTLITVDFLGITLRLFQSISLLTKSLTNVNNSHVHIEKVFDLEVNKQSLNESNYKLADGKYIELKNIYFKYLNSETSIFENLSLIIERNKHTVITGPNGSGKSTLLGLIAGIYYADKGTVTTFSNKLNYIGATPLIFHGTLYENIMYGNNLEVKDEQILNLLHNLDTFKEKKSYELSRLIDNKSLSSGQMQKIAFVRALVSNAEILLLDEATSNLDTSSKVIIFKLLSDYNFTVINSTHDPESFSYDKKLNIQLKNETRSIVES